MSFTDSNVSGTGQIAGTMTGGAVDAPAPVTPAAQVFPLLPVERLLPAQVAAEVSSSAPALSSTIWSAAFWKGAAERGVKTFFQAGLAYVGVSAVTINSVDWVTVAEAGTLGAILSLATSIGNASFTAGK